MDYILQNKPFSEVDFSAFFKRAEYIFLFNNSREVGKQMKHQIKSQER